MSIIVFPDECSKDTVSIPSPPFRVSFPALPSRVSFSLPPKRELSSEEPIIVSL